MSSDACRDLTDAQWRILDPLIPEPSRRWIKTLTEGVEAVPMAATRWPCWAASLSSTPSASACHESSNQRLPERTSAASESKHPVAWSFTPDGRQLAYFESSPETGFDIWTIQLDISDPDP
jgi:hypothetical protein